MVCGIIKYRHKNMGIKKDKTINIEKKLVEIKNKVEPKIKTLLEKGFTTYFQEEVSYPLGSGGKRLRPALAVLSCQMMGGKEKDILPVAAQLEIFHNYTLIVDDIVDNGSLRRGKPTALKKFGTTFANLISMDLAVSIFNNNSNSPLRLQKINQVLIKTMKEVTEGQMLDVLFERAGRKNENYLQKKRIKNISLKKYFKMISLKTASLISACCELGAMMARVPQKKINTLKEFGFNLGMAFQIQDDILDIFGEEKTFGKQIGKDIEERKGGNIVLLLAQKESSLIKKLLCQKTISAGKIKDIVNLIEKTQAKEKATRLQERYFKQALVALKSLPQNEYNQFLKEITYFVVQRKK